MKECSWLIEMRRWYLGLKYLAGVDEAGRGALAGPVFAAAVIFNPFEYDSTVKDSKLLTVKKRTSLYHSVKQKVYDWGVGMATATEIDQLNIRQASMLAMRRALESLHIRPHLVLVDGDCCPGSEYPEMAIINGDDKSFSISAASIIAKVERDEYMKRSTEFFPQYRFAQHKGYGTPEHIHLIRTYGPGEQHRYSFLRNILKDSFKRNIS